MLYYMGPVGGCSSGGRLTAWLPRVLLVGGQGLTHFAATCPAHMRQMLETLPEEVSTDEGTIAWKKGEQIGKGTFGAVYMGLNAR